ncbi:hypothetical protein GIB67_007926 [Kingdonia uniflora]|uniref:Late embryogenesis abundant protein LEA-2 subgroup domain-containing protein n=1 Tax=Kingdonia uniflora TaxID=39325 RepID=A0A7J7LW82_9MAGN|nr:hypothetical protein GIB67_007926 [Kingdonia uniflora]
MAERVYPSSKPNQSTQPLNGTTTSTTNNNTNLNFPPTKSQLYRPQYRPQGGTQPRPQQRHRSRRSCRRFCCCCFLWITLFLIALGLLAAIIGTAFYLLYQPHKPTFQITSFKVAQFNITTSSKDSTITHLNSKFNLTLIAKNPNKKVTFYYNPISVLVVSNGVNIGSGSINGFVLKTQNRTSLKSLIASNGDELDLDDASKLKTDLKKSKTGLLMDVVFETKVKLKIGNMKTKRFGIRVKCVGIEGVVPIGKTVKESNGVGAKCKVKLRIKVWKWYL